MSVSRRDFLREIGCSALTAAAITTGMERLFIANAIAAPGTSGYRALVCVFLFGGNDSNNMVIPIDGYNEYAAVRGVSGIGIPMDSLLPITPRSDGRQFGLHPSLTALHELWTQQRLAIVTNVGPLIEPLTRDQYLNQPGRQPYQLFSHSDQQNEWQTSYANGPLGSGWGGRIADLTQDDSTGFPTITSVAGVTIFSSGARARPLAIAPAPTPLNQTLMLKRPGDDASPGSALRTLLNVDTVDGSPLLVRAAARVTSQALANSLALSIDPVLGTAFANTSLANQLKQIAKLIKLSSGLGLRRQIFFCSLGGFDTHNNQGGTTGTQPTLLKQVSDAMAAFYVATIELGVANDVTTFTMSDFSRTFKPAASGAATGTDHAWGAHHFVLGGAVLGGDFFGAYPTLVLSGPEDTDSGGGARGRWIPSIGVDQYGATLATWFGVSSSELATVFPNIENFPTPNLGFMG